MNDDNDSMPITAPNTTTASGCLTKNILKHYQNLLSYTTNFGTEPPYCSNKKVLKLFCILSL